MTSTCFIPIEGLNNCISPHVSHNIRAESHLLADEKGPQDRGQLVVWVIHPYLFYFMLCRIDEKT